MDCNPKYDLVCRIFVQMGGGDWYIARDVLTGKEIDDDYSREHLVQRLVANGWKILEGA